MDDVRKASNIKRRKDSDPDLKLKRRKTGELQPEAGPSRSKPRTRGVHRVTPCPTNCLPSSPERAFHRQKLVNRITAQLRADGKVVRRVQFFEDGVAFDWILNNSVKTRPSREIRGSKEVPIEIDESSTSEAAGAVESDSDTSDSEDFSSTSSSTSSSSSSSFSSTDRSNKKSVKFRFRAVTAPIQSPNVETQNVCIPKVNYGRPRRLLFRSDAYPLVSVSMSNDIQLIDKSSKKRLGALSLPSENRRGDNVQDAASSSSLVVIGRKGDAGQLQVLHQVEPESKPQLISLGRSPHKGGINCLSLGDSGSSSCKVFSGGFDKSVVLWSIKQERSSFKSKVKTLPIKHKAYISALACRGETLLSASGKNVHLSDIRSNSSEAEVASAQFGTKVRLSSDGRNTRTPIETLRKLQVADLDDQMRVYDLRIGLRGRPQMQFGRRDQSSGKHVASELRKGATSKNHFIRGFEDGNICMWDYRKQNGAIHVAQAGRPVWHTIFDESNSSAVWSFSGHIVGYHQVNF